MDKNSNTLLTIEIVWTIEKLGATQEISNTGCGAGPLPPPSTPLPRRRRGSSPSLQTQVVELTPSLLPLSSSSVVPSSPLAPSCHVCHKHLQKIDFCGEDVFIMFYINFDSNSRADFVTDCPQFELTTSPETELWTWTKMYDIYFCHLIKGHLNKHRNESCSITSYRILLHIFSQSNFHICLHIFKGNSILMALGWISNSIHKRKKFDQNGKCSEMDSDINLRCPTHHLLAAAWKRFPREK